MTHKEESPRDWRNSFKEKEWVTITFFVLFIVVLLRMGADPTLGGGAGRGGIPDSDIYMIEGK